MMQSASTPEIGRFFSLAAQPQLTENSRLGSERKNRTLASGFAPPKSQTTQWGSWQSRSETASGPTVYLYDGIDSLNDVDQNGNVLARYTPGVWIDEPLAELASATTGYYQADALGSVSSISSPPGTLVNTYTYDSFGKLTTSTGTFVNRFQYTSRELDPETAQYYYRARYYDVNVGRFISEDPIRFKAGTNFYKYVNNGPLNAADPTGFCPPGPLPTPCRCSGSGGAPFVGVCKLQCTCGNSVDDYYFTISGLKRNCGWAGKTCPATIEGVQTTGFGGDKVVLPQKCYGLQ